MNIAQIEENVQKLLKTSNQANFIYDLLDAYGKPKASIKRLQATGTGSYNLAKNENEVLWKKTLYFRAVPDESIHSIIDKVRRDEVIAKHEPRFLTVTNFNTLLALDTKTGETLDIPFVELGKNFDFFLPWAGLEKTRYIAENPADVKAAEKMAKLFDLLKQDNPAQDEKSVHALNVFLSRLLFCFFAEDTEIFPKSLFTNSIASHTLEDGSDLGSYLEKLFDVLNTQERSKYAQYLQAFPYVNGGLFATRYKVPNFSRRSRAMLIECGSDLNWSQINPDIFGSMIQAVVHPDQRGNMGMHYTSVTNIMKVIEPLFLNDLYEEFKRSEDSPKKLDSLLRRIERIKIFDPACGSGNFLIIAYKELRKLEMEIFNRLKIITPQMGLALSGIQLSQFHGIELDDFAHEIAILSLWLAEHQMNLAFKSKFGNANPSLPLKQGGNIVCDNACRVEWEKICDNSANQEVYILGNPPYLGGKKLSKDQSDDMDHSGLQELKQLDYIGCWFIKASNYIKGANASFAFVATSSICQGEQVYLLWPYIFGNGQEIKFAHQPFAWENNARDNAGVSCIIVGVNNESNKSAKYIYSAGVSKRVKNISPYLIDARSVIVTPTTTPISPIPAMCMGSNPVDGTHLVLDKSEYQELLEKEKSASKYVKRYMGGNDLLYGEERYCLWIGEDDVAEALKIPFIKSRIDQCRDYRLTAGRDARKVADIPYRFCYRTHQNSNALIFPKTTSARRKYVPCGITSRDTVINVDAFAIYNPPPYIFSILSSRLHVIWLATTSGKLGTGHRYSVKLSYNNFPIPQLSDVHKSRLAELSLRILAVRELHSEYNLAELYDPDKMPDDLLAAHKENDAYLESIYQKSPFANDDERLARLFDLYEEMKGEHA